MKKQKQSAINPFVLIFIVIVAAGILSLVITPGQLEDGVYTPLPRNRFSFQTVFNIFRAIPMGLKDTANLVILIFSVGGALSIYQRTGAIRAGIGWLVGHFRGKGRKLFLALLVTAFSAMGGFLGWIEVLIPFCPLVVAVVIALDFDAVAAVAVVILGSMAGFMAGPTNLYTVAVCNGVLQSMGVLGTEESVFTGLPFRLILWVVITGISVAYILLYTRRVERNPEKSLMQGQEAPEFSFETEGNDSFSFRHALVLLSILCAMVMTVIGMQWGISDVKWTIDDISAVFLASALFSGLVGGMTGGEIVQAFTEGMRSAVNGVLIVGFARAVYWITNTANINATIIYAAISALRGLPTLWTAFGMVILVSLFNGLIPSGSGKGVLLGPILFPIAMELGLTAQTGVLAYQFGDGITNMFWFSYGTLMIFLGYAKVPIQKWWRFFLPLMGIFFLIAFLSLAIAVGIGY